MEGKLLGLLWTISLVMAAGSLLMMTGLITGRALDARRSVRSARIAQAIETALLGAMDGTPSASLPGLVRHRRIAARSILEMSTLIRGADFDAALKAMKDAGAEAGLIRLTASRNGEDRLAGIEALGLLATPGARKALRDTIVHGRTPRETIAAARALQSLGEDPPLDQVLAALEPAAGLAPMELAAVLAPIARDNPQVLSGYLARTSLPPAIRALMITALGEAGSYAMAPLITIYADDPEPRIRSAVLHALGSLGHPDARPFIEAGLDDPDADVRAEAARAAGRIALGALTPKLVAALADQEWVVRFAAADALHNIGAEARDALQAAANEQSPAGRAAAMIIAERSAA